jgi:hypothetical protein
MVKLTKISWIFAIMACFLCANQLPILATNYTLAVGAQKGILNGQEIGEVYYRQNVIIRFLVFDQGLTALERAQRTADAINQMAALGLSDQDVQLITSKNEVQAKVKNITLFTVAAKEAEINKTLPLDIAKEWLVSIKTIFDNIPSYRATDYTVWSVRKNLPATALAQQFTPFSKEEKSYFVAAHPYFPYGTQIRVINPANQWSVVVIIEERIPAAAKAASILLEPKAAKAIGISKDRPSLVLLQEVKT